MGIPLPNAETPVPCRPYVFIYLCVLVGMIQELYCRSVYGRKSRFVSQFLLLLVYVLFRAHGHSDQYDVCVSFYFLATDPRGDLLF